ncbi:MAG TPA: condensation domain-containing protein [Actinomycetota bacterium]|nr:condensation domain-containing protein [Actinomycetota bacterium]
MFWHEEVQGAGGCGWSNTACELAVPEGASLRDLTDAVETLVERHESLRTTYRADKPVQVVHAPRPVSLEQLPVSHPEAVTAVVEEAKARLTRRRFDLVHEFPLRAAVALCPVPVSVVLAFNHIALDGVSLEILTEELTELLRRRVEGTAQPLAPVTHQPLDQAAYEQSGQGRKLAAEALRYWEEQLTGMPSRVFPAEAASTEQQLYEVVMESEGLSAAAGWLGRRHRGATAVWLAAFSALLGISTGRDRCAVLTVSANRLTEATLRAVGCFAQPVPMTVDLSGDPSFSELVERARLAATRAYCHGQYAHAEMKALERLHAVRRGVHFALLPVFNFQLDGGAANARAFGPAEDPGSPPAVPPREEAPRVKAIAAGGRDLFVLSVAPGSPACRVMLNCDAATVPYATRFLQGLAALLVGVIDHPDLRLSQVGALSGVGPPELGPDWALVDNCWVRLPAVAELLREHPGVGAAAATLEPGDRRSLVAYVAARGSVPTPADLREFALEALPARPAVIAPHRYVVCRQAPDSPGDLDAWRGQEVIAEGSGRDGADAPAQAGARGL